MRRGFLTRYGDVGEGFPGFGYGEVEMELDRAFALSTMRSSFSSDSPPERRATHCPKTGTSRKAKWRPSSPSRPRGLVSDACLAFMRAQGAQICLSFARQGRILWPPEQRQWDALAAR